MTEDKYREEPEQYNADDRAQVNKARKKAAREKSQRNEVIQGIMSVKEGRKWVYHILETAEMFGNPHVTGDVYATHINIGMANLGKLIWGEVEEAAPESCALMLKEARQNEKE